LNQCAKLVIYTNY